MVALMLVGEAMIVAELILMQKKRKLTNNQMAESLSIHKVSWLRIKRCGIIGPETLLKALQVYPELKEGFLSSFTQGKAQGYNHSEKPQDKQESSFQRLYRVLYHRLKLWFCYPKGEVKLNNKKRSPVVKIWGRNEKENKEGQQ